MCLPIFEFAAAPVANHLSQLHLITKDIDSVDVEQPVYVILSGPATNINKKLAAFEVTAQQYTASISKDLNSPDSSIFQAYCVIPDGPRYKTESSKPVPYEGRYVVVEGALAGVERGADTGQVSKFKIAVDNLAFLGQSTSNGSKDRSAALGDTNLGGSFVLKPSSKL